MTTIEFSRECPRLEVDTTDLQGLKYSIQVTELFFSFGDKMLGGIGRVAMTSPPEIWIALTKKFRPLDLRELRRAITEASKRVGYLRARVVLGDKKAAKFAFACGLMWEEDVGGFHFFSVRG
mgnify:CR=1 FL=1